MFINVFSVHTKTFTTYFLKSCKHHSHCSCDTLKDLNLVFHCLNLANIISSLFHHIISYHISCYMPKKMLLKNMILFTQFLLVLVIPEKLQFIQEYHPYYRYHLTLPQQDAYRQGKVISISIACQLPPLFVQSCI